MPPWLLGPLLPEHRAFKQNQLPFLELNARDFLHTRASMYLTQLLQLIFRPDPEFLLLPTRVLSKTWLLLPMNPSPSQSPWALPSSPAGKPSYCITCCCGLSLVLAFSPGPLQWASPHHLLPVPFCSKDPVRSAQVPRPVATLDTFQGTKPRSDLCLTLVLLSRCQYSVSSESAGHTLVGSGEKGPRQQALD